MATTVGTIEYEARIDTAQLSKDAKEAERAIEKTGSSIARAGKNSFGSFAREAQSSFDSVATGIATLSKYVAATLIGGAFGLKEFLNQAGELQSVKASFESMTGSVEEAEKVLKQLYDFSFNTAFSTADINAAARSFLGAGLSVDELGKVLANVGDVAGATGADLGRLTLPLTQSLARGKILTQDYYQILDAGAGKLGQALQKEVAERGLGNLQDAMQKGLVTSEILFSTIEKSAQQGGFAFEGAIKQSKTWNGQLSNLQETIGNVALEILGVDKATGKIDPDGVFAKMSQAVGEATAWLNENQDTIKKVGLAIIDNIIPAVTGLAAAFTTAKVAAVLLSIAMAANPVSAVVSAITILIGALAAAYVKFEGFRNIVNAVFNALMVGFNAVVAAGTAVIEWVKNNWQEILVFLTNPIAGATLLAQKNADNIAAAFAKGWEIIKGVWGGVYGFFKGVWDKVFSLFKSVGVTIGDAVGGVFKSVINGVLSGTIRIINGFIDAINSAVGAINKIPGVDISRITRLQVPQLAEGGIVMPRSGGTLANLAEAGQPEVVLPLKKLEGMLGGDVQSGQTVNITLNMDGVMARSRSDLRDIAKDMIRAVNEELRSKGKAELAV